MTFLFLDLAEGMENCKMLGKSGKSQGMLKWMISGNPDVIYDPSEMIL